MNLWVQWSLYLIISIMLSRLKSSTGVKFDENGIRRLIQYMQSLGILIQSKRFAVSVIDQQEPLTTDFLLIFNIFVDENCDGELIKINQFCTEIGRRKKGKFYLNSRLFHLINKFPLSVQPKSVLALFNLKSWWKRLRKFMWNLMFNFTANN